jgi:hypothetical protein
MRRQRTTTALARTDLFRVDGKRTLALTVYTEADFHLLRSVLIERTQDGAALSAVELDVLELREYARPPGHDTGHTNEVIQVTRAEVAQRGTQWQVGDAGVHLRVDTLIVGIVHENRGQSDLVKNCEHCGRRVCEKVGEDGFG